MNLEIANMVMNIGEATKGFDWGDFWTALFGAGFGAYAAYRLNIHKQNSDEKRNKLIKLNKLINSAQMFGDKTNAYIENLYNSKISNTALSLDIVNVDEQEFSFLGNYNIHFLYFLNYFNQLINHLKTIIEQYNKATLLTYSDNLFDQKEDVVKIHNQLYEQITEDIFILRYINHIFLKHLYITKDRYFMKSFANDNFLKKTFPALEPIFLEAIKKYSGFKAYLQIDETFKKNYVNKTNTTCQKCNFQYWLNFVTSNIKSFLPHLKDVPKNKKNKEGGDDL